MSALATMVAAELDRPVPAGAHALAESLRARYGSALRAVVMYGSNLRAGDDREGVLDLYALVTSYRDAFRGHPLLAAANRLLPPNVFYVEAGEPPRVVRCKYAVLALDDLPRLTTSAITEPYFWARFALPCAIVWASDEAARATVVRALAEAVTTFVRFAVPFADASFDARALWTAGWQATYGAELRPERTGKGGSLFDQSPERFERATELALAALPWTVVRNSREAPAVYRVELPLGVRARAVGGWKHQRIKAKLLFTLRILRNSLIFEGGIDYALWKIQRHSGIATDSTWREKRHPWLALGAEAWRLYRARAFR
jgi:hypothetical protein